MKIAPVSVYLGVGLTSATFAASFTWVFFRVVYGDPGPGDIGLGILVGIMLLAQGVPLAGLGAFFLHRRRERGDPSSRGAKVALVAAAAVLVVVALFFGPFLAVPLLAPIGASALFAWRLAELRRPWIIAWLVYSVPCLLSSALALAFFLYLLLHK